MASQETNEGAPQTVTPDKEQPVKLPTRLPLFPLKNVILLPGCLMPINIFEDRYLQMVSDSRQSSNVIGLIQPCWSGTPTKATPENNLYTIGGAGLIRRSQYTENNQQVIELFGLNRFKILQELKTETPYRMAHVEWLKDAEDQAPIDRPALFGALEGFLKQKGISAYLDIIAASPDTKLVNTLSMIIPLSAPEKQALLETDTDAARAALLTNLLEMSAVSNNVNPRHIPN